MRQVARSGKVHHRPKGSPSSCHRPPSGSGHILGQFAILTPRGSWSSVGHDSRTRQSGSRGSQFSCGECANNSRGSHACRDSPSGEDRRRCRSIESDWGVTLWSAIATVAHPCTAVGAGCGALSVRVCNCQPDPDASAGPASLKR